jgi:hypothetical protein
MMNKLMSAFLVLLLPGLALACPDLSGSYLCKQNSYHKDTIYTFSQTQHLDNWIFEMTASSADLSPLSSFMFLADGKERTATDRITGQNLQVTAVCEADLLKVFGSAKAGETVIHFSEILSLTKQGDLINESLDINGATVQEICQRHSLN